MCCRNSIAHSLAVLTHFFAETDGRARHDQYRAVDRLGRVVSHPFALMQFAVGVSLDRYGPRLTATVNAGHRVVAAARSCFAAASEPWMVIAAMTLIGIGLLARC